MPAVQVKEGRLESPAVLGWVRRQRCRVAEEAERRGDRSGCVGPIDPHHVDHKGLGGARCRDDRVVPLCRLHHDAAHDHRDGVELMSVWADETRCRFLDRADPAEVRLYFSDLQRWKERPLAVAW